MKWSEAREIYPNEWLLFEAIDADSKDGKRVIKELSVINVFDDGRDALKRYTKKHKKDKHREMYVYNTENKALVIEERNWSGMIL